ncbi:SU10 major capsid protein [Bradyrhizobium sp. USDA 4350]
MAQYTSYDLVGIKENVSDVITNLSPRKTPFQSSIGNEKVTQPLFQWQEDVLRPPAANAAVEGADASFITIQPTTMRNNYTQIFTEALQVSDRADVVATYGRKKEMAYQMAKSSAAIKRDREITLVGLAGTKSAGSKTVASTMDSMQAQLDPTTVVYSGASDGTKPLTEALLIQALQTSYTNGAEPTRVQVTPSNSVVLAGFAAAAGRYRTITGSDDKKIVNVVNLYVSPFGEVKVEINRWLRAKNTFIFEPDQWSNVTLRPWERKNLAKTGDSTKAMLLGEFSLKHKNHFASALIVEAAAGF